MKRLLHDPAVAESVRDRIGSLDRSSGPRWGEMSVGQMLAHCAEVQEVLNGKPLEGTPWYARLASPLIKRAVLSDRPYPRGIRTHPQYLVTDRREFVVERDRLLDAVGAAVERGGKDVAHPMFGRLTPEEAGWAGYKHLDHHLTQFGV